MLVALPALFVTAPMHARAQSAAPHVRPEAFLAQLDHCRTLVDGGERAAVLGRCFRHAADLLEQGLRRRAAGGASGSPELEARLRTGAREIARQLRTLPVDEPDRRRHALEDLAETIAALRADLSRIAASEHVELSLISRGGVSLGNWQAGFLYTVTEWAKVRPGQAAPDGSPRPAFSTVTGASAGAVNGLAAAVEGCRDPRLVPSESLYYRVWMQLGLFGRHGREGLFTSFGGSGNALALFSSEALDEILGETRVYIRNADAHPACRVDYGFVTTHLDRTTSPIHVSEDGTPILTTKKLKEKFAVRLSFDRPDPADPVDPAPPPDADSAPPPRSTLRVANLGPTGRFAVDRIFYAGLGHEDDVPLDSLLLGVQASAAFPGAFPPVSLAYTQWVPGPGTTVRPRYRTSTFIDGGVLDNTPVGLAVGLDAWRGVARPSAHELEGLIPPPPRTYLFLEPEVRSWVRGIDEAAAAMARDRDLLKVFAGFAGDLLVTSMDAQLSNTAEQYPFMRREHRDWTRPRLSVPRRHMPITGEQFLHFMAFLERDFRVFDFYVGMADAYEYLARESCFYASDGAGCGVAAELRALDRTLSENDPYYRCIRDYYESEAFRVLKRIDLRRLPESCGTLRPVVCKDGAFKVNEKSVRNFLKSGAVVVGPKEGLCAERGVANHNFRVLLVAMHNYKVWMQSDGYARDRELDHFFEELAGEERAERFVWVDLPTHQGSDEGLPDAEQMKHAFRALMQEGVDRMADEQSGFSKLALQLGGRTAADATFERIYPTRVVGVGIVLNGFEGTYGRRLFGSKWRWDFALRYYRIDQQTFFPGFEPWTTDAYGSTQATRIFAPVPYADVEVGAGWAVSETFAYDSLAPGHVVFRTGPRFALTVVAIQRIYVGLNIDYYPVIELDPSYRAVLNPDTLDWQWNLSAGWRFLF